MTGALCGPLNNGASGEWGAGAGGPRSRKDKGRDRDGNGTLPAARHVGARAHWGFRLGGGPLLPHCPRSLPRAGDGCPPAHQPEPGEPVVEGVSAGHHVVTVLDDTGGYLSRPVVHLTHQVQTLPAGCQWVWALGQLPRAAARPALAATSCSGLSRLKLVCWRTLPGPRWHSTESRDSQSHLHDHH